MEYTTEVADHVTGEISEASLGEWMTITEYGQKRGVGPRKVRNVLSNLGILRDEIEDCTPRGAAFNERKTFTRRRLTPKAVRQGLGKRLFSINRRPFDVLSPKGQEWIEQRWDDAVRTIDVETVSRPSMLAAKRALEAFTAGRRHGLSPEGKVLWLLHHFKDLQQVDISRITGASERMVSHYVKRNRLSKLGQFGDQGL
ncbi:hypothetical protein [Sinorhizobium meliloti]|uniref:hypothetical protein n=1 Tax=Rhizobium meliloti TaxID=382 RepID=UPI00209188E1|nr:hypothetical protein [Sinorhizobium meliloti]MCO5961789.1 hypothetical protein [Sinorhizobium meliloti]